MRHAALLLAFCFTGSVFAQSADTPFQVRYWTSANNSPATIRVVNDGASATSTTPPSGTLCANFYAFPANGQQMLSCCVCPVAPNALLSLPLNNNLVPYGQSVPSALVVKMIATVADGSGFCAAPSTVNTGSNSLGVGLIGWIAAAQETPFTPSTLSAAELSKLNTQCGALATPASCKSCPAL